ncbi:hypothetical protein ACFL96_04720 [Thermoproteota archaeon]
MKKLLLFILCVGLVSPCFAETIYLKSGKQVTGTIIERTDEYVKVDFLGVPIKYFTEDIERIEGGEVAIVEKSAPAPQEAFNQTVSSLDTGDREIANKIRDAQMKVERMQMETVQTVDMKDVLSVRNKGKVYIDYDKKILYVLNESEVLEVKSPSTGRKADAVAQDMVRNMFGDKEKVELLITQDSLLIKLKGRWIKVSDPCFPKVWGSILSRREGHKEENIDTLLPSELRGFLTKVISKVGYIYDLDDIGDLEEGELNGESCFVLDINIDKAFDREGLSQQVESMGPHSVIDMNSLKTNGSRYHSFISKDTYLQIGEKLLFIISGRFGYSKRNNRMTVETTSTAFYPETSLDFFPHDAQITVAKNVGEFNQILERHMKEKMKKALDGLIKTAPKAVQRRYRSRMSGLLNVTGNETSDQMF